MMKAEIRIAPKVAMVSCPSFTGVGKNFVKFMLRNLPARAAKK